MTSAADTSGIIRARESEPHDATNLLIYRRRISLPDERSNERFAVVQLRVTSLCRYRRLRHNTKLLKYAVRSATSHMHADTGPVACARALVCAASSVDASDQRGMRGGMLVQ